jgi:hypothetical protein
MIRKDIDNLNLYRLAPRKVQIENDLKYAFWHGFINEYIYNELLTKVQEKYNSIFD